LITTITKREKTESNKVTFLSKVRNWSEMATKFHLRLFLSTLGRYIYSASGHHFHKNLEVAICSFLNYFIFHYYLFLSEDTAHQSKAVIFSILTL